MSSSFSYEKSIIERTIDLISCIIIFKQIYEQDLHKIARSFCHHTSRYSKNYGFSKSFTNLTVQEFDDIYNKEITKDAKHKIFRSKLRK